MLHDIRPQYFYHQDANYSVVGLTVESGYPLEHYEYDPYGQVRIHTGQTAADDYDTDNPYGYQTVVGRSLVANPLTFTGRWLDHESGLMYYRARVYNPTLGRFVQQDPMGALATSPTELVNRGAAFRPVYEIPGPKGEYGDGLNLYQYVGSSPLSQRDPSGCIYDFDDEINDIIAEHIAYRTAGVERVYKYARWGEVFVDTAAMIALESYLISQAPIAGVAFAGMGVYHSVSSMLEEGINFWNTATLLLSATGAGGSYAKMARFAKHARAARYASSGGRVTGQLHHGISKKVWKALEKHPKLKGKYTYKDPRFTTQAKNEAAHRGYQRWHRKLDNEVVDWIQKRRDATPATFEYWLRQRYLKPDLLECFPNGL